jgi:hypothetical protein
MTKRAQGFASLCTLALCLSLGFVPATRAAPVPGQGTWETTLQPRDLNRDGVADAFYDTVLNITWLADGNALDDVYGNMGRINLPNTQDWVSNLNVFGMRGWRLPMMKDTGAPGCVEVAMAGTDCGLNVQTISADGQTVYSELGHLFYVTLGNLAMCSPDSTDLQDCIEQPGWGLSNTGGFRRLQDWIYWTGVRDVTDPQHRSWVVHMRFGAQSPAGNSGPDAGFHAIAVHPGDIGMPEPPTSTLVLGSLFGLWLATRRGTR